MRNGIGSIWIFGVALILPFFWIATGWGQTGTTDENIGMGKLGIRSQAIGQSMRLTIPTVVPGDMSRGWQFHFGCTWTNVWANDREFLLDYEMLDTFLGIGYGFDHRFGLGLMLDNRSYFGGAMDGFIEGFHNLFGIDNDGRDTAANGENAIQRFDPDTGALLASMSASDLNNTGISLLLNYDFHFDHPQVPAMNVYGVVRYALQPPKVFDKGDRYDYGVGVGIAKRWFTDWYTYAVFGYTFYADRGRTTTGQVELVNRQFTGLLAQAWQYRPGLAFIVQYLFSEAGIKTLEALDKPSHEVHLGFKWRVYGNYVMDFALIENVITLDNSPDFGVHLGLSRRF